MKAFHEVRNYISDFMVWHGRYTNISFIAHWHREIELIYVDSGCAEIHVTDDTIHAKTGALVICDSGDIHYCNTHTEDSVLDFLLFDTGILSSQYQYHSFMSHLVSKKDMDKIQFEYRAEIQELMKVIDKYVKQNPSEKENKTLERFFDLLDVMDMEW